MFVLLVIVLNSSGSSVTSQSIIFDNEVRCLEAISKVLELEKGRSVTVKARCLKQQ